MARRSDHSREEIRDLALAQAENIIIREGLSKLSARKIAVAIGYTVGTLYHVFTNLDDLLIHVNGKTLDELYLALEKSFVTCNEPQIRVMELGNIYMNFAFNNVNKWNSVFEHHLPKGQTIPQWYQDKIFRIFNIVENALRPIAPERTDKELQVASRSLWGGIHGICILALSNNLGIVAAGPTQELIQTLMQNFLAGFTQK